MITYKYTVTDFPSDAVSPAHKTLEERTFDTAEEALDYAKNGLVTFITRDVYKDGVLDEDASGEIVWSWDSWDTDENMLAKIKADEIDNDMSEDFSIEITKTPDNTTVRTSGDDTQELMDFTRAILGDNYEAFDCDFVNCLDDECLDDEEGCPDCAPAKFDYEISEPEDEDSEIPVEDSIEDSNTLVDTKDEEDVPETEEDEPIEDEEVKSAEDSEVKFMRGNTMKLAEKFNESTNDFEVYDFFTDDYEDHSDGLEDDSDDDYISLEDWDETKEYEILYMDGHTENMDAVSAENIALEAENFERDDISQIHELEADGSLGKTMWTDEEGFKVKESLEEASSSMKKAFKNGGEDVTDQVTGKAIARIKDPKARAAAVAAKKAGRDDVVKQFTGDRKEDQADAAYEKKATKMQKAGYDKELEESAESTIAKVIASWPEKGLKENTTAEFINESDKFDDFDIGPQVDEFADDDYWDAMDQMYYDENITKYACYLDDKYIGTVEAETEDDAIDAMKAKWPNLNYNAGKVEVLEITSDMPEIDYDDSADYEGEPNEVYYDDEMSEDEFLEAFGEKIAAKHKCKNCK